MKNKNVIFIGIAFVSAILYYLIFYHIARYESLPLLLAYSFLFCGYFFFSYKQEVFPIWQLLLLAISFRLIPIVAIPSLSDDFYRFIWDGRLWAAGINPFAATPQEFMAYGPVVDGVNIHLFNLLNSPTTYTVYPPIPQYINLVAAWLFPRDTLGAVVVMRIFTYLAEGILIFFLIKLLKGENKDKRLFILYALNPLVIIELSGNLHHEALLLAFLVGAIYFYQKSKLIPAGVLFALSVASKLLPLMFLPIILLRRRNNLQFLLAFLLTSLILFYPLVDSSFITGMANSLKLYYQRFEFNAGLYYLARALGYSLYGYNAIAIIGKLFFLASVGLILYFSVRFYTTKKDLPIAFTYLYLVFAILSIILHPWYILLMVAMAPLSNLKFPIVWSFLIFFTYLGYSATAFTENYWVVASEMLGVAVGLWYDFTQTDRSNSTLKEAP